MDNKLGHMGKHVEVQFAKVRPVKSPCLGTLWSAGIDFFVPDDYPETIVPPRCHVLIPSGIKVKLAKGWCMVAKNKSGIASKYHLDKMAELVDPDYQGEIHISVINNGSQPQTIKPGMKLIQFVVMPYLPVTMVELPEKELYSTKTKRGEKGFGSTGES